MKMEIDDTVYCIKTCNILGTPYNIGDKYYIKSFCLDLNNIENCLINGIYFYFFDGSINDIRTNNLQQRHDFLEKNDNYYPKFNDYFVHYLKKERKDKLEKLKKASN
jgi:hypothetical protein